MGDDQLLFVNTPAILLSSSTSSTQSLTLHASPKTDIYATPLPPITHTYSAPIVHRRIRKNNFVRAKVTVTAVWSLTFDQGGLVFTIPDPRNPNPNSENATTQSTHPGWVKCGVEIWEGKPYVSIVGKAKENWCDWSMLPVAGGAAAGAKVSVTLEMTRSKNALMIYQWAPDGDRMLIRKVPWVFLDNPEGDNEMAYVGVYAARPDPDGHAAARTSDKDLPVMFEELEIQCECI